MSELFHYIIAIFVVIIVIRYQIRSFSDTKSKIKELASIFPNSNNLSIVKSSISESILESESKLQDFISNPKAFNQTPDYDDSADDTSYTIYDNDTKPNQPEYLDVNLIKCFNIRNGVFKEIINETNSYLCKNIGTCADFNILQDICERKISSLETQIQNSLNVPLYLGLGGTFIGIIIGLSGIVINMEHLFDSNNGPVRTLLFGVSIAMIASLIGLALSTWNTSVEYKKALKLCDEGKNYFYDFIRRELMPCLSASVSSNLSALKNVLGEFIGKFGKNLSEYTRKADILNDNIDKQHQLLVELNKMDQVQMATKIADTFKHLSDSSDSFEKFHSYQKDLNQTINSVNTSLSRFTNIISSFEDFSESLKVLTDNQRTTNNLQNQFQAAIEQHFPLASDARERWRRYFDELNEDAAAASNALNDQLKASTEYIRNFSKENNNTFASLGNSKEIIDSLIEYTKVQATCYKDMKEEIRHLKETQVKANADSAKLNADLLVAVNEMIVAIKTFKE